MTDDRPSLAEPLATAGGPDPLRVVVRSMLQLIMEANVNGVNGAGRDLGAAPIATER